MFARAGISAAVLAALGRAREPAMSIARGLDPPVSFPGGAWGGGCVSPPWPSQRPRRFLCVAVQPHATAPVCVLSADGGETPPLQAASAHVALRREIGIYRDDRFAIA